MAVCLDCGQEMLEATSCTVEEVIVRGGPLKRISFGSERPRWRTTRCGDCGVAVGGFHHPGCDIEQCPSCRHQAISCDCVDIRDDEEGECVDVPFAISVISRWITDNPEYDHVNIEPVAACGHVGRGHVRDLQRNQELPLDEWFQLGGYMGKETAAILFVVRSEDFEKVTESDFDIARSIAAYATAHHELPWELVYVTRNGNFRASELLGLPGHPDFGPCPYAGRPTTSPRRR